MNPLKPFSSLTTQPWRKQWLLLGGLLALSVFAWLPDGYGRMMTWGWLGLWQGGFVAIALWLLVSLRQYQQPWQPLGYGLDWGMLLVGVVSLASGIRAAHPEVATWYGLMVLGHGVLLYALRNWAQVGNLWEKLWTGLCGGGVLTAVISLGLWLPDGSWWVLGNGMPLGEPGFVAGYFVLLFPLVVALAIAVKGWGRLAATAGSAVMLMALYTTGSRTALVAIALVGVMGYLAMLGSLRQRFSLEKILGSTALLAGILATVGLNPQMFGRGTATLLSENPVTQLALVDSVQDRFFLWATSLDILQSHPLTGLGMGNWGRQLDVFHPLVGKVPNTPHLLSTPLQVLSELGLAGAIAGLMVLFLVLRLWVSILPYVETGSPAELFLYGMGASWLGYGIVCLTDYQLEHLAISTTLVAMVAILLAIAHQFSPVPSLPKTPKQRRNIQLLSLFGFVIALSLGLPTTLAAMLNQQAHSAERTGDVQQYQEKLQQAHTLAPWQHHHLLDLGLSTWQQRQQQFALGLTAPEDLSPLALEAWQGVIEAVPFDLLQRYNYGAIAADLDPVGAISSLTFVAENAIGDFPYTYALLADSYRQTGQPDNSVATLYSLQLLAYPEFALSPRWETDETLQRLAPVIYPQAIAYYDRLLEDLPPADALATQLYEEKLLLQWWRREFLGEVIEGKLRPLVRGLILAEAQPQRALELINQALQTTPADPALQLLQTWLDPEVTAEFFLGDRETVFLRQPQQTYDTLQQWLQSSFPPEPLPAIAVPERAKRYRLPDMENLSVMLPPNQAQIYPLAQALNLFGDRPDSPALKKLLQAEQRFLPKR